MKRIKRLASYLLVFTMLLPSFAMAETQSLTSGVYAANGTGFAGDILLNVTVDNNQLTNIEVVSQSETESIGGTALKALVEEAVASSAFEADSVSGATYTSSGFNEALQKAYQQAAGIVAEAVTETNLTDGTYTVSVPSLIDVEGLTSVGEMTLEATFAGNEITAITVPAFTDTFVIGGIAFEKLAEEIIANQSTAVDAIAGATVSSRAFLSALDQCIEQAGGEAQAFKARTLPEHVATNIHYDTDIVVIGAGMAGLTAAIQAADNGASVIICEMQEVYSSSTSRSVGEVVGANTLLQKENGIEDTTEAFYNDIYSLYQDEPTLDTTLLHKICDDSTELNEFLIENGVEFDVLTRLSDKGARATMRSHISKDSGSGLTNALVESAQANGATILLGTRVYDLVMDDSGKITGVLAETIDGDQISIDADATIVCGGSYTANPEMLAELNPKMDNIEVLVGCGDGSCYTMLEESGADMIQLDYIAMMYYFYGASWTEFPESIPGSPTSPNCEVMMVDGGGNRVVSEDDFTFEFVKKNYGAGYSEGYAVYGQATADKYPIMTRLGLTTETARELPFGYTEDTLAALAADVGIDAQALEASVARYNELCAAGVDEDFSKKSEYMVPIEAPYYVLRLPMICTDGYSGARINENAEVIDTDGHPIPGLYAVGSIACAQVSSINYNGCGTSLLICGVFGRAAADDAVAKYVNK